MPARDSLLPAAAILGVFDLVTVGRVEEVGHVILATEFAPRAGGVVDQRLFAVDSDDNRHRAVPGAVGADAPIGAAIVRAALVVHDIFVTAGQHWSVIAHVPIVASNARNPA